MKTLLIITLILSSTFAFSETREEHQKRHLKIKLDKNEQIESDDYAVSLMVANLALIGYAADYDLKEKIKKKANAKPTIRTPFLKLARGASATATLMTTLAAGYYLGESFISTNEGYNLKRELKKIESEERNTREKVAETSKKKTIREISAIDMN